MAALFVCLLRLLWRNLDGIIHVWLLNIIQKCNIKYFDNKNLWFATAAELLFIVNQNLLLTCTDTGMTKHKIKKIGFVAFNSTFRVAIFSLLLRSIHIQQGFLVALSLTAAYAETAVSFALPSKHKHSQTGCMACGFPHEVWHFVMSAVTFYRLSLKLRRVRLK